MGETSKVPGGFTSNDARRHDPLKAQRGEKKGPPKTAYVGPRSEEAPEELKLAWHVMMNHKEWDKTPAQKNMRMVFEGGPFQFRKHYWEVEREWEEDSRREGSSMAVVEEEDVGTERCVELCEKLLREIGEGR